MELREQQAPIKESYLEDPESAKVTLTARGSQAGEAVSCSVDLGRMVQEAQAHEGVGGPGTGACSGDLLLGALAACAQVTSQMVAANTGIDAKIEVVAEGVVDLRGTLGVDREAPVGFESISLRFEIDAPDASAEELEALHAKSERYCTVLQTLLDAPKIESELVAGNGG